MQIRNMQILLVFSSCNKDVMAMSRSDSTSNLYNVVLVQSIFIPMVLCIFLCLDTAVLYRLDVFSINARIVKI